LIGIVALCLFAARSRRVQPGHERNLLGREPRRVKLLCGKFLALAVFIVSPWSSRSSF